MKRQNKDFHAQILRLQAKLAPLSELKSPQLFMFFLHLRLSPTKTLSPRHHTTNHLKARGTEEDALGDP